MVTPRTTLGYIPAEVEGFILGSSISAANAEERAEAFPVTVEAGDRDHLNRLAEEVSR